MANNNHDPVGSSERIVSRRAAHKRSLRLDTISGGTTNQPMVEQPKPISIATVAQAARIEAPPPRPNPFWEYPRTDLGAADLFTDRHGEDVRFVHGLGWMTWNGSHWSFDNDETVRRMFSELARRCLLEAAGLKNKSQQDCAIESALQLQRKSRADNALSLARCSNGISTRVNELNSDPFLLGTANGVVDLRTGQFRAGKREDLITRRVAATFDRNADCQRWKKFIEEITLGDQELTGYLQRAIGYAYTGSMKEQVFLFLFGAGSNGKSVFIETVLRLAGDYAAKASPSLLMTGTNSHVKDPRNELAELPGVRLLSAPEVERRCRLNESIIKDITGGDSLRGEAKYKDGFTFHPACKIVMFGNHKPSIAGTDNGIWRRVRLIPFEARFEGETKDDSLRDKLEAEFSGILNWVIEGARKWYDHGLREMPAKVTLAVADYRSTEDLLGCFVEENLREERGVQVKKRKVYERYRDWAEINGQRHCKTAHSLNKELKDRGFHDADGSDYWHGWTLSSQNDANS